MDNDKKNVPVMDGPGRRELASQLYSRYLDPACDGQGVVLIIAPMREPINDPRSAIVSNIPADLLVVLLREMLDGVEADLRERKKAEN